ncbi:hypothetical protein E2C01_055266 [Portunus trituberculatus]|uniref:Uncharacterized protein n=1 Tax=Portunus trituberculatus TaxID=210409 RepID=A0A5B7GM10_PORTR|nr:hypothetical protein [Portunus trituberculatus]
MSSCLSSIISTRSCLSIFSIPLTILYNVIRSPLSFLSSFLHSYVRSFSFGTIFVAILWMF